MDGEPIFLNIITGILPGDTDSGEVFYTLFFKVPTSSPGLGLRVRVGGCRWKRRVWDDKFLVVKMLARVRLIFSCACARHTKKVEYVDALGRETAPPLGLASPLLGLALLPGEPAHAARVRCRPTSRKTAGCLKTALGTGKSFNRFEVPPPPRQRLYLQRLYLRASPSRCPPSR